MHNEAPISPHVCRPIDPSEWSGALALPGKLAKLWNRLAPRGKGAVPRQLGRAFAGSFKNRYLQTKHGAKLAISPPSLEIYAHMLNTGCTWNEPVLDACRRYMSPEGVFYDMGANIGYLSIEMAQLFGGKAPVVAFEPQPELAATIAESAQLNGFDCVKVFECMLGETPGEAELFIGSHTIHASAITREEGARSIKRPIETLDRLVGDGVIPPPTVIKMDIEGGELAALTGGKQTLSEHRPHLIFESDENMDRFGYSRSDLLDLIGSCAEYEFFFLEGSNVELTPITPANINSEYTDILAQPVS